MLGLGGKPYQLDYKYVVTYFPDCPAGEFRCISEQQCPQSKELLSKIAEAQADQNFGQLGRFYTQLSDIPRCDGNAKVCCSGRDTCGQRLVPDTLHVTGGSNVTIQDVIS